MYIDESGDLGDSEGSSKFMVISALLVKDPAKLDRIIKNMRRNKFKKQLKKAIEITANNSSKNLIKHMLFELNKLNIETMKLGKKHKILQKTCKQFLHLLDSRLKILKFEAKYAEEFGESFSIKEMLKVMKKWQDFSSKITEYNIKSEIKKLEKWMSFEISRDYYYLTHEAKSVSVFFEKEYLKKWLDYNPNAKPWIRKSRMFQQIKVARLMRSVFEKMAIVEDRDAYGLSLNDQRFHELSIKSKISGFENQYDEIFKIT